MQLDQNGFFRPTVKEAICIHCGLCEKKCPAQKKISSPNCNFEVPVVYAAFAKDEQIRIKSSSGGIFSILAQEILNQGGVVFGASQETPTTICHIFIERSKDLEKLRGSKYLQSHPGKIYRKVKEFLKNKRKAYFQEHLAKLQLCTLILENAGTRTSTQLTLFAMEHPASKFSKNILPK